MPSEVTGEMAACLRTITARGGGGPARALPLRACAQALKLDGLALVLAPGGHSPELWQSFGPCAEAVEDLQLVQGHGPTWDAARTGHPVLIPDLGDESDDRWPGLAPALLTTGITALFTLPLRVTEPLTLGALAGYRTTPGPLTPAQLTDARHLTGTLAHLIAETAPALLADGLRFAEVHQAAGMAASQLRIPPSHALLLLRAHAFSHNTSLLEVAREVLARRLHLDGGLGADPS
ncbi:GAF and ANTAR domain-containing protein [Streptomyces beigongshangae]|uniref:GAF and ANTAR domain-containing protein n=1 Tax=Streptomyces beigongshangae TaxID=2841597 RepID=UPI001C8569F1|nr:GAF and ANTAR domain-containing protein [Streptomyces sp. REN17]